MDLYEAIEKRTSIRKYKPEMPPREIINKVLHSALHAPSGKNRQNWRFYVVTGEKRQQYLKLSQKSWLSIRDILAKRLKPSLYEFTERFFFTLGDAPVLVFCFSVNSAEEKDLTSIGSVYMGVQNINLACQAEGLGICTMGAPLEIAEDVYQFLGLSPEPSPTGEKLQLLCGLTMGYPDHQPPKAPRQVEGRITWIENNDCSGS